MYIQPDAMKNRFLLFVFVFASVLSVSAQENDYDTEMADFRAEKLEEWEALQLSEADREDYGKLTYFPLTDKFKVEARFVRTEGESSFKMPTSGKRRPEYVKYGELHFSLDGKMLQLTVYQNIALVKKPGFEKYLFVPFTDHSSGNLTYGGGRYIDVRIPDGETMLLDFNKCYQPYCSYGPYWSCPIPPKENALDVEILAGEKLDPSAAEHH